MQSPITVGVILLTVLISIKGFRDAWFRDKLIFYPEAILRGKQGYRLITSGFLHADWMHLLFNMYSLYAFGQYLEWISPADLLLVYFGSIIGGGLLSLFLHRHHEYLALGASGGVCGVIFACIFLVGTDINLFMLPIPIPAWLYAILFLLGSFYGIKKGRDNIGHDAHLGGAIIGLVVATVRHPGIVREEPYLYCAVMGLSVVLLVYLIKNPLFLPLHSFIRTSPEPRRELKPMRRAEPELSAARVDAILDKVSKSGMNSLTAAEQQALAKASRRSRQGGRPGQ